MDFDIVRATLLALIQGITEFLPISSSAHLILPSALLQWPDQGLAFDVAVHLGSLLAVIAYFRRELAKLILAWFRSNLTGVASEDSRLAWILIVATLPTLIAGLLFKDFVETSLRSITVIAFTTIIFGVLLLYADRKSRLTRGISELDMKTGILIGLAQVLSIIPGTSRSGITMTVALLCHLDREAASRFSFLLSIPVIAGASLLLGLDLLDLPDVNWMELLYGMLVTAGVAYLCIHYFLKLISNVGFLPFVIYRLLLGLLLLFLVGTPSLLA